MATRIRSPISPMSGHSPATRVPAIRTGSWLAPEAPANTSGLAATIARLALAAIAIGLSLAPLHALAARHVGAHSRPHPATARSLPYPNLELPLQIGGGQYAPVAWSDIAGWSADDHLAAYKAFRASCKPIAAQSKPPAETKALGASLRDPCHIAKGLELSDVARAKAFFEENFTPLRISRLGEGEGFVTGYYEPVIDGSRTQSE